MSRRRLVPPGWDGADPGVPRFWGSTEGKAGTCEPEPEVKCPPATHTHLPWGSTSGTATLILSPHGIGGL